ncbi:hypothetical protein AA957_22160 [Pseudomonas trivialis]|uniref:Uncharacterized protein n=1 Tax=Pseudomonas trivialis TaxID=200450 RepID=A0A0H5AF39_9PSED|nr:hypothetical protein AA957_22160 [Pseudomonas trivialis]
MQHVLDRSLYQLSKSVMLPADLLQRPSGHCTEYSTIAAQIQGMKKRQRPLDLDAWRKSRVGAGLPAIAVGQYWEAG